MILITLVTKTKPKVFVADSISLKDEVLTIVLSGRTLEEDVRDVEQIVLEQTTDPESVV